MAENSWNWPPTNSRTAEHLARHGLKVPPGSAVGGRAGRCRAISSIRRSSSRSTEPARWRSLDRRPGRFGRHAAAARLAFGAILSRHGRQRRLLCGPNQVEALPACRQFGLRGRSLADRSFLPAPPPRRHRLPIAADNCRCRRALDVPRTAVGPCRSWRHSADGAPGGPLGWLGIDLVLGSDPAGADDVVIEINPRLTTSYLGLRRLARGNLAAALLAVARGEPAGLSFRAEPLQFAPDGRVSVRNAEVQCCGFWRLTSAAQNLKAADGLEFLPSRPFPLWRRPTELAAALAALAATAPPADRWVATMTGELADCFATKAEGVSAIVEALAHAADGRDVSIYLTDGRLVPPAIAIASPLRAAAANWHALARFAGATLQAIADCSSISARRRPTSFRCSMVGRPPPGKPIPSDWSAASWFIAGSSGVRSVRAGGRTPLGWPRLPDCR